MSDLQDFIAEQSGVTLHRRRVLTAFNHLDDGPLMNVLFNMTRPPLLVTKPNPAHPRHAPHAPSAPPAIVRKGMVNYRRELYGTTGEGETGPK
jgi:hypothetical protein